MKETKSHFHIVRITEELKEGILKKYKVQEINILHFTITEN